MATVSQVPRQQQRLDALAKARASTQGRARLMAQFRRLDRPLGSQLLIELLDDLPDCLLTLEAWRFVSMISGCQSKTWRPWLARAGVGERREMRCVTDRQREILKAAVASYGLAAA